MTVIAPLDASGAPDAQAARQLTERLADSAWGLAAVSASAEYALIEQLDDAGRPDALAEACGLPVELVTRLLDVLVALGVVTRRGSRYAASQGAAEANETFPGILLAFARANLLQVHALYERGRHGRLDATGWGTQIRISCRRRGPCPPALPIGSSTSCSPG